MYLLAACPACGTPPTLVWTQHRCFDLKYRRVEATTSSGIKDFLEAQSTPPAGFKIARSVGALEFSRLKSNYQWKSQ